MTDDRTMELQQFGAYTESIDMGPVCLCARQGTDLSAPFAPVLPATHLDEVFRGDRINNIFFGKQRLQ